MQYLLLIYQSEAAPEMKNPGLTQEYQAYTADIVKSGQYVASHGLQPVSTATTVRVREGKTLTTDGPFAETREQLGGIYVVEAKDLDEAIKIAAGLPSARFGSIEVRPVWGRKS